RQALLDEVLRLRHRQLDDRQRPAAHAQRAELTQVRGQHGVVRVGAVRLDDGDHRVAPYEPGQVVDVAVGIVTFDAFAEPQNLVDAERAAQQALDVGLR